MITTRAAWRTNSSVFAGMAAILASCSAPPATAPSPASGLAGAESAYADLRSLRDRYDVLSAAGMANTAGVTPLTELARSHDDLRAAVLGRLTAIDSAALPAGERRALGVMRATIRRDITPLGVTDPPPTGSPDPRPDCGFDAASIAKASGGLDSLRRRIYDCY